MGAFGGYYKGEKRKLPREKLLGKQQKRPSSWVLPEIKIVGKKKSE